MTKITNFQKNDRKSKFCNFKTADGRHIENHLFVIFQRFIVRLMRNLESEQNFIDSIIVHNFDKRQKLKTLQRRVDLRSTVHISHN